MNILVTGATGFVGKNLVKALLQKNHNVTCAVRNPKKAVILKEWGAELLIIPDLSKFDIIADKVNKEDVVVHIAGTVRAVSEKDYIKTNAEGTKKVAQTVLTTEKRPFMIYLSSLAAAGPSKLDKPITEEHYESPITPYGRSKFMGELMLKSVYRAYNCNNFCILRPPVIYGPFDKDVYTFFKLAKQGILPVPGNGKSRISIIHVNDVVESIFCAIHNIDKASGNIYFIDDNKDYSWLEICEFFRQAVNPQAVNLKTPIFISSLVAQFGELYKFITKKPALLDRDKITEMKISAWTSRSYKIRKELGFKNKIDLKDGIYQTYRWYKDNRWL